MAWTKVDYDVALEVASHEAIIRQAYKDSVGVWTWSVGLTRNTGHNVKRYIGKPQPLEHCLRIYVWALNNYADQVRAAFRGHSLTKAQFAAALSFHWNTGSIGKASWVKKFKAGDIAGARRSFMAYSKPKEIIPRRKKERDLFFDGNWSNDGAMIEYTRVTSRSTPDWRSAKRINVERALNGAFKQDRQEPAAAPKRQILVEKKVAPQGLLKPEWTSKTIWAGRIQQASGYAVPAWSWFTDLHWGWKVAITLAGVSLVILGFRVVKDRKRWIAWAKDVKSDVQELQS